MQRLLDALPCLEHLHLLLNGASFLPQLGNNTCLRTLDIDFCGITIEDSLGGHQFTSLRDIVSTVSSSHLTQLKALFFVDSVNLEVDRTKWSILRAFLEDSWSHLKCTFEFLFHLKESDKDSMEPFMNNISSTCSSLVERGVWSFTSEFVERY
jgi:hypothetical protein